MAGEDQVNGTTATGNQTVTQEVDDIRNVKVPPFWQANPELWFVQLEAQFYSHKVTSDSAKYYSVVSTLDSAVLQRISDLLVNPPATDKYKSLKEQLIARFTDSQETQLRKLLTELKLEDRKPSQLLREMKTLAGNKFTEDVIKTLWLQRLPVRVQEVLAVTDTLELSKLADIADKILGVPEMNSSAIYSVNAAAAPATISDVADCTSRALAQLQEQIKQLTQTVQDLKFQSTHQARRNDSYRHRSKSRTRSTERRSDRDYCYYHSRFGDKARKCSEPCSFNRKESGN